MEIDGDGVLDLLSGCYSRHEQDMAGLLYVCRGVKGGGFRAPEVLQGTDGKPLILTATAGEEGVIEKICTRPCAADLDGDGKLDLVVGNFGGTFAFFRGEGGGKFAPTSTWLQSGTERLEVEHHGDPVLADWDGDGDLDLISGSSQGGVFLFVNGGTRSAPKFGPKQVLVPPPEEEKELRFGDAHVKGPQQNTRVWVADLNGDGKLDLLVGDQLTLLHLQKDVTEEQGKVKLAAWKEKQKKLFQSQTGEPTEAQQKQFQTDYEALEKERETFAREVSTGFVWKFLRKS